MSFFNIDVHSEIFTPQEYPQEFLELTKEHDLISCCLPPPAKNFITFMLFKEYYYKSDGNSLFIQISNKNNTQPETLDHEKSANQPIPFSILSSIPTINLIANEDDILKLSTTLESSVVITNREKFRKLAKIIKDEENEGVANFMKKLKLVVIDNVHEALNDVEVREDFKCILSFIENINSSRVNKKDRIRSVFLTVSLFLFYGNESDGFWRMEETFRKLHKLCGIKVDTSSDIVSLLRYSPIPKEKVITYIPLLKDLKAIHLVEEIKDIMQKMKDFLNDTNFNARDLFGIEPEPDFKNSKPLQAIEGGEGIEDEDEDETDSIEEEIQKIPDPVIEPFEIITKFEWILNQFGPWCADRSLIFLIQEVDKHKLKTPYERHYLLLGCLQIRLNLLQIKFRNCFNLYKNEPLELLENFSSPKLLSLLNILRRFNLTQPIELLRKEFKKPDLEITEDMIDNDSEAQVHESPKSTRKNRGRSGRRRNVRFEHQKKVQDHSILNSTAQIEDKEKATDIEKPVEAEAEPELNSSNNKITVDDENEQNDDIKPTKDIEENLSSEKPEIEKKKDERRGFKGRYAKRPRYVNKIDENALCGIIFLENRFDARILFQFLREAARVDPKLIGLNPTISICPNPEYEKDSREAEMEHKKREESLRRFRYREANLLIGTSILEDGIELPKCNLVVRFDSSKSFRSYMYSKGRAISKDAEYYIFSEQEKITQCVRQLCKYKIVEEMLLSHSIIPKPEKLDTYPDDYWNKFPHFKTANLNNSISIINRYCARLPSDTFTRLTPIWEMKKYSDSEDNIENNANCISNFQKFSCSLRLPINSPIKFTLKGIPMQSENLAKRAVALQMVMILHANLELDDLLMPIGKEGVNQEPDLFINEQTEDSEELGEFRPGSTKRRQYYDKQLAPQLIKCLPITEKKNYLYWLKMRLTCPIPEDQNTRGRKIHHPENALQWFGIILNKEIPPLPPFPIYTRCGEVLVEFIRLSDQESTLTKDDFDRLSAFHHYTFTSVLRLDKYLTLFDPHSSENSYFVVPLKRNLNENEFPKIDWIFVNRIWKEKDYERPSPLSNEERKDYNFCPENYEDAVVMPWYRNNDQPQYFYVAEICINLTPQSQFPGCEFKTFEEYYKKKYQIEIQNATQPLLDVDHTSARLNFLTPRYVNRKGVALPTSSENTKRAKRENLEQKQILVPELCTIHPFSASLWRQAVSLPCILYRANCLLLSNNIRATVAKEIYGIGLISLSSDFNWEPLNFGWSLADIVKLSCKDPEEEETIDKKADKSKKEEKKDKQNCTKKDKEEPKKENGEKKEEEKEESGWNSKAAKEINIEALLTSDKLKGKSANEILLEEMKKCKQPQLEIGTWSNDMAADINIPEPEFEEEEDELLDPNIALPSNIMMLDKNWAWGGRSRLFNHRVHRALYGSPTHWGEVWDQDAFVPIEDTDDPSNSDYFEGDNISVTSEMSGSDEESYLDEENNLKIQFHNGNTAEALDKRKLNSIYSNDFDNDWTSNEEMWWKFDEDEEEEKRGQQLELEFEKNVETKTSQFNDIIDFESLNTLSSRASKKDSLSEEVNNSTLDPYYETLFNSQSILKPQPTYPESENYFVDNTAQQKLFNEKVDDENLDSENIDFSFDFQPSLKNHIGPSPSQILQALTMSNANDGLNLERLETIGDSFLKYAITSYLFCTYENIHEGKLSHLRSKQVSNVHLYRLGKKRGLGGLMVAAKFEPHDNWLPPCYHIPTDLDKALIHSKSSSGHFSMAQVNALKELQNQEEMEAALKEKPSKFLDSEFIPYNLVTQQSIPDKSIADCVEALIGAYLTSVGPFGALLFMSWLGMRVLPNSIVRKETIEKFIQEKREIFYIKDKQFKDEDNYILFDKLQAPKSPLLRFTPDCEDRLNTLLKGYEHFEESIKYKFRDRSYLLQAFTHASYSVNNLTDCYQRLEFLGDAILDYLITRHLYEDSRQHSPGALTDLRSALVNNTIFASLAVKNGFHKYFRHSAPGLSGVLQKFSTFQEQHGSTLTQDYYLMGEEECEEAEDIEVPKALGDVFESIAGAIFLDSGMSLDAVWRVYYRIMKKEIDQFSENVPKSPIRELLELEPETAKFGKPEKLWDGRRVRVSVEIFGIGIFRGIGRNYRIAKCTAAKCALKHVRKIRQNQKRKFQTY